MVLGLALFLAKPADGVVVTSIRAALAKQGSWGSCRAGDRSIDMERVAHISDRKVFAPVGETWRWAEVRDTDLLVFNGTDTRVVDLAALLEAKRPVDVEASFALLNGKIVLFWKEPLPHRAHQQGLISFDGISERELCAGRVGVDSWR